MQFEARIAPLDGKLPKVTYRWDPETDILSVVCKGVSKATGMNGTVDLEGADGSFVVLDVAGGAEREPLRQVGNELDGSVETTRRRHVVEAQTHRVEEARAFVGLGEVEQ